MKEIKVQKLLTIWFYLYAISQEAELQRQKAYQLLEVGVRVGTDLQVDVK